MTSLISVVNCREPARGAKRAAFQIRLNVRRARRGAAALVIQRRTGATRRRARWNSCSLRVHRARASRGRGVLRTLPALLRPRSQRIAENSAMIFPPPRAPRVAEDSLRREWGARPRRHSAPSAVKMPFGSRAPSHHGRVRSRARARERYARACAECPRPLATLGLVTDDGEVTVAATRDSVSSYIEAFHGFIERAYTVIPRTRGAVGSDLECQGPAEAGRQPAGRAGNARPGRFTAEGTWARRQQGQVLAKLATWS